MMRGYAYGYPYMMGGGIGVLGWVLMIGLFLIVLVGVVLLVIWAVRAASGREYGAGRGTAGGPAGKDEALAIARRRLASGEITPEQFEEIRKTLG